TGQPAVYQQRRPQEGRLFLAWDDRELAGYGFEPQESPGLRRLDTDDGLLALEARLRPPAWGPAPDPAMARHPAGQPAAPAAAPAEPASDAAAVDRPAEPDPRLVAALADADASRALPRVAPDELADLLARPIEDWMVYLDPGQQSLVDRIHHGAARIRGAAGTGKTVVALHRARRLARAGRRGLFTTYVRSLPEIYHEVFARFAPEQRSLVEFANVHRWALRFLHRNGVHPRLAPTAIDNALKHACDRTLTPDSPLVQAGLSRAYLR